MASLREQFKGAFSQAAIYRKKKRRGYGGLPFVVCRRHSFVL